MIALDMDGTVLNDKKEVTTYTKQVLEQAMDEGVVVMACTGRPSSAIPETFASLRGVKYAITSNGARIVHTQDDKVIFEKLIEVSDTIKLLNIVKKYDTYREVFWNGIGYTSNEMRLNVSCYFSQYMCKYIENTRVFIDDIEKFALEKNQPCDKLHIAFRDLNERKCAIEEVKDLGDYELESAMLKSIEITAPGINKGTGIICLGEMLGIKKEEIMAVGDGMNDISMLREVGFPVAMGNGLEEVKKLAQYVTDSNNEDGVAKAVKKFVLS